jgi:D-alanyl-D-alanine carboxypeptidase/D-alanyl-D-alanine-endopeptidase (penicillin-binding protein 4)
VGTGQGVYVETEDGSVLVAEAAADAVHPASVSKVPTTLALLRELGADYRFATRVSASGPLQDGEVQGDLVFDGSGDPFFVDENALLVSLALRKLGLKRVRGDVASRGPFFFNWASKDAARRLQQALGGRIPEATWSVVQAAEAQRNGAPGQKPTLAFGKGTVAEGDTPTLLVTHRSQPLIPIVKALNGYSNNIFAPFSEAAGGIAAVEAVARESVPAAMHDEITLGDGAGAHPRNRLSPRAAVALLRALGEELAKSGHTVADVLPVAGVDEGTLRRRLDGPGERGHVVGKTGTYGDYGACALAGVLRTRDAGDVYFAILNHGVPIQVARRRQDAFVRALLEELDTEPWAYEPDDAPAFTRAEVSVAKP